MRNAWLALLGLLIALGSACGDSEPDLTSYTELLRFVPNDPEYRRWITVVDYQALRSLPAPEGSDGLNPVQDLALRAKTYANGASLQPLGLHGAVVFPEITANWEAVFGLTVEDAERSLTTGPPGRGVGVFVGHFDAEAMDERLADCTACTQPTTVRRGRLSYYDWGAELGTGDRLTLPVFDNLGRGGTYRFTDRYVLRGLDRTAINGSLDAIVNGTSALEYRGFRELADVMDQFKRRAGIELFSVSFTDIHSGPTLRAILDDRTLDKPIFQSALQQQLLRPYAAVALAVGSREGEPIMVLSLAHRSAGDAEENIKRLNERLATTLNFDEQPWSASFSSWEVEADGSTLIAVLDGQTPMPIALAPVPLLFHE